MDDMAAVKEHVQLGIDLLASRFHTTTSRNISIQPVRQPKDNPYNKFYSKRHEVNYILEGFKFQVGVARKMKQVLVFWLTLLSYQTNAQIPSATAKVKSHGPCRPWTVFRPLLALIASVLPDQQYRSKQLSHTPLLGSPALSRARSTMAHARQAGHSGSVDILEFAG